MDKVHPLRSYREREGLTQRQLAESLGVTRTTVARWETFVRNVDGSRVQLVSDKTGIPKRELRPDLAKIVEASVT
jgi:transcriptional regulator with XRE-family HTH domain